MPRAGCDSAYADYALRVLRQAALRHPQRVTVDEVAAAFGISRHHLAKVVHDLGRSGHLRTQRGAGGGFTLAWPAARTRLGDIARLGDETATVIACADGQGQPCRLRPARRSRGGLDKAAAALFGVLDGYSVADLVKQPAPMRAILEP